MSAPNKSLAALIALALCLAAAVAALAWLLARPGTSPREAGRDPRARERASLLEARGLYEPALRELERDRDRADLTGPEEAELLCQMARLADEKLNDCSRALPYYTLAAGLAPQADWAAAAGKRSVVCLEKLGRSREAQALLVQLTGGELGPAPEPGPAPAPVVAVVDGRSVTWDQVESAMRPWVKDGDLSDQPKRQQALRDYLVVLILAEESVRNGLDEDPKVKASLEQARREALAQAWLARKLPAGADAAGRTELIKNLFQSHQARTFDEAIPAP